MKHETERTVVAAVEALPSGFIDNILQQQQAELLDNFNFEVSGGNALLEDAEFVCFADTNHIAPDHNNFGKLIEYLRSDKSIAFVEAVDTNISKTLYNLPNDLPLVSWENPEAYYLEILLSDTQRRILEATKKATIPVILQELAFAEEQIAQQRELLAHPERIKEYTPLQRVLDPQRERLLQKPTRMQKSYDVIKNKSDALAIAERNKPLEQLLDRHIHPHSTKTFLIAGENHYTEDLIKRLNKHKFIILRPTNLPRPTSKDIEEFIKPLPTPERAVAKQNWLRARTKTQTPR